jgi:hypothetical protein
MTQHRIDEVDGQRLFVVVVIVGISRIKIAFSICFFSKRILETTNKIKISEGKTL